MNKTEMLFEDYKCYKGREDFGYHPLRELIKSLKFKEPILDIGCGNGILLEMFKDKNHIGIDASDFAVNLSKSKGLNVYKYKINDFDVEEKFKSIMCIGLVGTIDNREVLIKKISELLDDDGRAYISFPHTTFFYEEDENIEHSFTLKEIRKLLNDNGLKIEKTIGLNKFKLIRLCKNIMVVAKLKRVTKFTEEKQNE